MIFEVLLDVETRLVLIVGEVVVAAIARGWFHGGCGALPFWWLHGDAGRYCRIFQFIIGGRLLATAVAATLLLRGRIVAIEDVTGISCRNKISSLYHLPEYLNIFYDTLK